MSLNDNKLMFIDSNTAGRSGFATFTVSIPKNKFPVPPTAIKILNTILPEYVLPVWGDIAPGLLVADQDCANNHIRIRNPATRTYVDIYFPELISTVLGSFICPATNLSGYGVNPLLGNWTCANFFEAFINAYTTPNLGITFTFDWMDIGPPTWDHNVWQIEADAPYIMEGDVPDTISILWGFGRAIYAPTNSTNNYQLRSLQYIQNWDTTLVNITEACIFIISDLVWGTDSGIMNMNQIADSRGIICSILFWQTDSNHPMYIAMADIDPYINIQHSKFVNLLKSGTGKYDDSQLETNDSLTIKFKLEWPHGYAIRNLHQNNVKFQARISFSFKEPNNSSIRMS